MERNTSSLLPILGMMTGLMTAPGCQNDPNLRIAEVDYRTPEEVQRSWNISPGEIVNGCLGLTPSICPRTLPKKGKGKLYSTCINDVDTERQAIRGELLTLAETKYGDNLSETEMLEKIGDEIPLTMAVRLLVSVDTRTLQTRFTLGDEAELFHETIYDQEAPEFYWHTIPYFGCDVSTSEPFPYVMMQYRNDSQDPTPEGAPYYARIAWGNIQDNLETGYRANIQNTLYYPENFDIEVSELELGRTRYTQATRAAQMLGDEDKKVFLIQNQ